MTTEHDVRADLAGWGDHRRLTCFTSGCNFATLVSQPWMSQAVFDQKVEEFLTAHPCSSITQIP